MSETGGCGLPAASHSPGLMMNRRCSGKAGRGCEENV